MDTHFIAVAAQECDAKDLANRLALPYTHVNDPNYDYLLIKTPTHLELRTSSIPHVNIKLDFSEGRLAYRRHHGGTEYLLKAIGYSKKQPPSVVDATAGFGKDAFIMACYGVEVTMLEKNPIMAALLQDALSRLQAQETLPLHLIQADAIEYLSSLTQPPDTVYLDPMFPARQKSALVKKEMQFLQQLLHHEAPLTQTLLEVALKAAKHRVVVKRPKQAPHLSSLLPNFVIKSKNYRYDVYILKPDK